MRLAIAIGLALGLGCGDSGEPAGPASTGVNPSLLAEAGDRLVVARVDGVPVYGDCVQRQTELGSDRREALEACVEIELLVSEAARRGLSVDPEVVEAGNREMVRAFIQGEYYDKFTKPGDVEDRYVRWVWNRGLKNHFNRVEHRSAYFCRAQNPDPKTRKTPPNTEADRKAKKVAERLYARVRSRRDLAVKEYQKICQEVGAATDEAETSHKPFRGFPEVGRAVPEFAEPTFDIPKVGMVSPPSRTPWGWDVILLTEILPARSMDYETARPTIREWLFSDERFEDFREHRFKEWTAELGRRHDIERFDENLPAPDPIARGAKAP